MVISAGGQGGGTHTLWNRNLPSGSYAYTGLQFTGSNNGAGQTLTLGATATGTYEVNSNSSSTTTAPADCGGGGNDCGRYGIWGPNQATFATGQSLTIAGGSLVVRAMASTVANEPSRRLRSRSTVGSIHRSSHQRGLQVHHTESPCAVLAASASALRMGTSTLSSSASTKLARNSGGISSAPGRERARASDM